MDWDALQLLAQPFNYERRAQVTTVQDDFRLLDDIYSGIDLLEVVVRVAYDSDLHYSPPDNLRVYSIDLRVRAIPHEAAHSTDYFTVRIARPCAANPATPVFFRRSCRPIFVLFFVIQASI
jgi:hypothetical protein